MADTDITVQTLINNSIARAKDEDKTQWDDDQLLIFCNKAYDYIHKILIQDQNELVITSEDITMIAAVQEYSLEDNLPDFWGMAENGVYFAGQGIPLIPVPYEDKIRSASDTTDDAPDGYYVTSEYIGVMDTPTATSVAAYPTLTCRYFKKNTTLSLTDNMPFKNLFNEPISYFIDHIALLKTTDPTTELTALYNALEESTMKIARKRTPL